MQKIKLWALLANAVVKQDFCDDVDDVSINNIDDFLTQNVRPRNIPGSIINMLYDWGVDNAEDYVDEFIYELCCRYGVNTLRRAWDRLDNIDFHNPRELKKATRSNGFLMTIFGYLGQKGYESFNEMLDDIRIIHTPWA